MGGATVKVTATVDTGFNGHLTLPPAVIASLGLLFMGKRATILADGRTVVCNVYSGLVNWHGVPRAVEVDETASEPLVGMRLLEDSALRVTCRPGGRVRITPSAPPPRPLPDHVQQQRVPAERLGQGEPHPREPPGQFVPRLHHVVLHMHPRRQEVRQHHHRRRPALDAPRAAVGDGRLGQLQVTDLHDRG